ncbi:MAG: hydroxyacylglutathione hydrolase [Lentisphaeria bacterium]|jgi:hydroxyacylglutathione hydrolase
MDHVGGVVEMSASRGMPIEGPHQDDRFWIELLRSQAQMMGFAPSAPFEPNRWLAECDEVALGGLRFKVHHCPAPTPGHVMFFELVSNMAFVCDVLFKGSIGRTDFPRGDYATLVRSIREKLWPLGDRVVIVPGHGPLSTFGEERLHNPFVADSRKA